MADTAKTFRLPSIPCTFHWSHKASPLVIPPGSANAEYTTTDAKEIQELNSAAAVGNVEIISA